LVKVAVTLLSEVMVTVQDPVPVQAPDHPVNVDPADAVAVNVTLVPERKASEQFGPQLIPGPETVPEPSPVLATESVYSLAKVAVTVLSEVMVTVQDPVPEQPAPVQPVNCDPAAGVAVSVTVAPERKASEQSDPQLIPGPVTVPEPPPVFATDNV
jgi:hypothetical protein